MLKWRVITELGWDLPTSTGQAPYFLSRLECFMTEDDWEGDEMGKVCYDTWKRDLIKEIK